MRRWTATGLRHGELCALVVADLELEDTERASVRICAKSAKNRREARLPLRPATAATLKALVAKALPLPPVFGIHFRSNGAMMILPDLARAGIPYADAIGRVVDFHSLRVTFATNLARSRVPLQLAQRLMRHSDPRLTSSIYTVLNADDERPAVAALPELAAARPQEEAARATGTGGPMVRGTSRSPAKGRQVRREPDADRDGGEHDKPPTDERLRSLAAAWDDLDERARGTVLQAAKALART